MSVNITELIFPMMKQLSTPNRFFASVTRRKNVTGRSDPRVPVHAVSGCRRGGLRLSTACPHLPQTQMRAQVAARTHPPVFGGFCGNPHAANRGSCVRLVESANRPCNLTIQLPVPLRGGCQGKSTQRLMRTSSSSTNPSLLECLKVLHQGQINLQDC